MKTIKDTDKVIDDVLAWADTIKNSADFKVKDITLDQAKDWSLENGIIHHTSNRFFKVLGVSFEYPNGKIEYQPLLEQREIGTLGFLWRNEKIPELLVQAKIEPGNIGIVQLAPSCQATESNADQVHGGDISPFSDVFVKNEVNVISSSLQSEQGSRFWGKMNRNVLATLKNDNYSKSPVHKWIPVDVVLKLIKIDYVLNTDARSVLVCSDWEKLVGREPFSSDKSAFNKELFDSFYQDGCFQTNEQIKTDINNLRGKIKNAKVIPLDKLPGFEINEYGVKGKTEKPFGVKYIEVQTKYREVSKWNQPIIESCGSGIVNLICGRINGILHFLFKPTIEPGLINKVELGPSVVIEPGEDLQKKNTETGKILIESWQSDEGGRFYQDKSLYQIIDIGEAKPEPDGYVWLSIKQIKSLLDEGGWLTNEARSALSLLLTWL